MDTKSRFRRDSQPRFPQRKLQPAAAEVPPYVWQCAVLDLVALYPKAPVGQARVGYVARHSQGGIDIADMFDPQSCMTAMETHFVRGELSAYETLKRDEKLKKLNVGDLVEVRVREGSKQMDTASLYTIIAMENPRRGTRLNTHWFAKVGYVVGTDADGIRLSTVNTKEEPIHIHYDAMREAHKVVPVQKYAVD